MFTIVVETNYQALDKAGNSLTDPSASSAEARKRAVLKALGMKAFIPSKWAEAQGAFRKNFGPMRIVKETVYCAHEDGKPIGEPRDQREAAKADVAKAIEKKVAKADKPRAPKKEGES